MPAVAEAPLTSTWCGLRPGSRDGLPYLGETAVPGLWVSSGHYRNGVLLGCGTADLLAAAIVGQTPALSLAPFSPRR
jgi:glycine oxidase